MLGTCELNKDMFFIEQDVKVLSRKLAQKNTNYIKLMRKVCVHGFNKTPIQCFSIKKPRIEADGGFIGKNMPFTLCIQTPWQREMMVEHGHQRGVAVDATFGTNGKKVIYYV